MTDCASFWSAFVRIQEAIQLSNLDAVRRMGLKPGDIVFKPDDPMEQRLKEVLGERWESVASLREVVGKRPPAIWRNAPLAKGPSSRTYGQISRK